MRVLRDNSRVVRVFPELRQVADPVERARLYMSAYRSVRWFVLLVSLAVGVPGFILWIALVPRIKGWLGSGSNLSDFLVGFSAMPVGVMAVLLAFRICFRKFQKAIRRTLRAQGYPLCLRCGYDLKGQTELRCPECGSEFDLALLKMPTTATPPAQPEKAPPR